MRVRALDSNGDMTFGKSSQNYLANSAAAVAQLVYASLMLFLGEWFLDTAAGVPWLTEVIGIGTSTTYDTVIKNCIQGVPGVNEILTYSSSLVGTLLTISDVTVSTDYGVATLPLIGIPIPNSPGWGVGGYGNNHAGA